MMELIDDLINGCYSKSRNKSKKSEASNERQLTVSEYGSENSRKGTNFFEGMIQKLIESTSNNNTSK